MEKNVGSVDVEELKRAREALNSERGIETDEHMYDNYNPNRKSEEQAETKSDDFSDASENNETADFSEATQNDNNADDFSDASQNDNQTSEAQNQEIIEDSQDKDFSVYSNFSEFEVNDTKLSENLENNINSNENKTDDDDLPKESESNQSTTESEKSKENAGLEDEIDALLGELNLDDEIDLGEDNKDAQASIDNENEKTESASDDEIELNFDGENFETSFSSNDEDDESEEDSDEHDESQSEDSDEDDEAASIHESDESETSLSDSDDLGEILRQGKLGEELSNSEENDKDEDESDDENDLEDDENESDESEEDNDEEIENDDKDVDDESNENDEDDESNDDEDLDDEEENQDDQEEDSEETYEDLEQEEINKISKVLENEKPNKIVKPKDKEPSIAQEDEPSEDEREYLPEIDDYSFIDIISKDEFRNNGNLTYFLGKNEKSKNVYSNLKDSLSCVVFGEAGTGRNSLMCSVILSLMLKNSKANLEFVLCDSLNNSALDVFAKSQYLFLDKIAKGQNEIFDSLDILIEEIEDRYNKLSEKGSTNIDEYNDFVGRDQKIPYVVLVLNNYHSNSEDEVDRQIDEKLFYILKYARIVGIYAFVFAQSTIENHNVNFNLPTRISFKTENDEESIEKIGQAGAENLANDDEFVWITYKNERIVHLKISRVARNEIEVILKSNGG